MRVIQKAKKSKWPWFFISLFTLLNFALSVVIRIYDRKAVIKAIETDEGVKTLLVSKKETKVL